MTNALAIQGLTKTYEDFTLDHVSFTVPSGSIVGLIGENGAGKSTTINAALGLIRKEDGRVAILGNEELSSDTKEQIGVVFDGSNYPEILSPGKINRVMKHIYHSWDEQTYFQLLKQFSLPVDKQRAAAPGGEAARKGPLAAESPGFECGFQTFSAKRACICPGRAEKPPFSSMLQLHYNQ